MNDRIPGTTYDNPIWHRGYRIYLDSACPGCSYAFVHDNFDGAPDSNDCRFGYCDTVEKCKADIDDIETVLAEGAEQERAAHSQFGAGA